MKRAFLSLLILPTFLLGPRDVGPRREITKPPGAKCYFKYDTQSEAIKDYNCSLSKPIILKIENKKIKTTKFEVKALLSLPETLEVTIENVKCTSRGIYKTALYSNCKTINKNSTSLDFDTAFSLRAKIGDEIYTRQTNNNDTSIEFDTQEDPSSQKLYINYTLTELPSLGTISFEALKIRSPESEAKEIPPYEKDPEMIEQEFIFPLDAPAGVTQWHGESHTGIDFAVYKKPVLAVADGTVKFAGWDSYYGECLSGGNIVRIEHANGMNSLYMHLDNYKNQAGAKWKTGDYIKKGELVGISGNSGAYNCETLGYHLHFELRKAKDQSTHINPVPYIDIDWDLIPSIGSAKYDTENPHPGR